MKKKFLIKKSQRSCWVKKGKTEAWWENFSNSKVLESDWKADFSVSKKSFCELCTKLHPYLQKKQNRLRIPMSIEVQVQVQVAYYISVESAIGKLQNFSLSFALIYHDGVFRWWQYSSGINGLVHLSQLRIHLVHWKTVLDASNVLRILCEHSSTSFISLLSITQLFQ